MNQLNKHNNNMNQIEFNYETYLEGGYKLVTRGGIEVPRENLFIDSKTNRITYKHPEDGQHWWIHSDGVLNNFRGENCHRDLLMIPIQTDETIPFDLEKWKSGEWDVVSTNTGETANYAKWLEPINAMGVIWNDECNEFEEHEFNLIRLKRKPITPFTHPHLYEVSDDPLDFGFEKPCKFVKYYDYIEGREYPHTVLLKDGSTVYFRYLRLKHPTEITKDQAFDVVANLDLVKEKLTEKFGEFKIKE